MLLNVIVVEKNCFTSVMLLHYVKPTQEKQPAQIIIHVGTNDLPGNTNSGEIANEIVEFANSIKTSENNVVVFSIVSRKDRFNNKAKEVNKNLKGKCAKHNLRHHNSRYQGLHLSNYGDKQLTRNFTSFIENGKYMQVYVDLNLSIPTL